MAMTTAPPPTKASESPVQRARRRVSGKAFLASFATQERALLPYFWRMWSRPSQLAPVGDWITWVIMAGRGFGKTRAGAEWIRHRVDTQAARRIALVGRPPSDVRDVMIEGESGLLAVWPSALRPRYEPSKHRLTFHTGATATVFSSENPDQLRGPQHDTSWCCVAGTLVAVPGGEHPIEDLRPGDEVVTRSGIRSVVATGTRWAPVGEIVCSDGRTLRGTAK